MSDTETVAALIDLCDRTEILETKMQQNIDETINISSKVKKLMEMMQGLESRLEDVGLIPRRTEKQLIDFGSPSALLPTPTSSIMSHVSTGPLEQHEVRADDIIDSIDATDSTQTILNESTTIEVTLKPISYNLLSSLLHSEKIPTEKENLVSISQFVVVSGVENLGIEAVRQNAYESLSSILPPEKPPDEFVTSMKETNSISRTLSRILEVDTLSHELDPQAEKWYTTQALTVHIPGSWFIRKIMEQEICHRSESTMVDDNTHSTQQTTRNICLQKFLQVEETIGYEPHPESSTCWTICRQRSSMCIKPLSTLASMAEKGEQDMEFRVVDGFDVAKRATRKFFQKFKTLVVIGEEADKEVLKMAARTTLRTKLYEALIDQLTDIGINTILSIRKLDEAIDLFMAEILHMRHKFDLDTRLVEGLVLNHCSRNPDMKRRAEDLESFLYQLAKVNSIRLPTHAAERKVFSGTTVIEFSSEEEAQTVLKHSSTYVGVQLELKPMKDFDVERENSAAEFENYQPHVTSKLKHNSNAEVNNPKGLIIVFSLKKSNDVEKDGKAYLSAEVVTDGAHKGDVKAYEVDQMHFDSMSEGQAEEKNMTENEANITEGKDNASHSRVCDDEKKKHEKTKAPECINHTPMNVVMHEDSKKVFKNQKFGTVKFIVLKIGEVTGYIRFEDPTRSQNARAAAVLAEDGGIASTVLQVCIYKRKHLVLTMCVLDLLVDKTNGKKYKGLDSGIG